MKLRGTDTSVGQAAYCLHCRQHMPDGPDACLGFLPGVSHACCGHGDVDSAYVVLGGEPDQPCTTIERWVTLRGIDALVFFKLVRDASESTSEEAA